MTLLFRAPVPSKMTFPFVLIHMLPFDENNACWPGAADIVYLSASSVIVSFGGAMLVVPIAAAKAADETRLKLAAMQAANNARRHAVSLSAPRSLLKILQFNLLKLSSIPPFPPLYLKFISKILLMPIVQNKRKRMIKKQLSSYRISASLPTTLNIMKDSEEYE